VGKRPFVCPPVTVEVVGNDKAVAHPTWPGLLPRPFVCPPVTVEVVGNDKAVAHPTWPKKFGSLFK